MARINIEERWWTDPRRSRLIKLMGGDEERADGAAVRMWRLAQEFWKQGRQSIPGQIFGSLEYAPVLLGSCLAEQVGENGPVYVRGSAECLEWACDRRSAGQIGGKKSALRPRDAMGRLLKGGAINDLEPKSPSKVQAKPSTHVCLDPLGVSLDKQVVQEPQEMVDNAPPLAEKTGEQSKQTPSKSKQTQASSSSSYSLRTKKEGNLDPTCLVELWNQNSSSLPKVRELTNSRRLKIGARLKECGELGVWEQVVKAMAASRFCCGDNDRGWEADFDFLLKPDTRVNVLEGKYANRKSPPSAKKSHDWTAEAEKVRYAIRKFGSGRPDETKAYLGEELYKLVRAVGGMRALGLLADNDFTTKTIASRLKAASDDQIQPSKQGAKNEPANGELPLGYHQEDHNRESHA